MRIPGTLMGRPPTINGLCATGNATGSVGAEIGDQVCYLFWLQEATDGSFCDHDLLHYG